MDGMRTHVTPERYAFGFDMDRNHLVSSRLFLSSNLPTMSARPLILSLTTRGFRAFKLPFAASYRRAMSSITAPYLLAPRDLQQKLDANNKVAILDVTWLMPNTPRSALEEFQAKRIPGAQRLDLDEVASPNELGLMHMMPSSEIFAKACGEVH